MGIAAGDVDNDGDEDLYITALEGDRLYRNDGAFKFTNVTKAAGIVNANFGTSAAFLDYDRDGRLDLFVANYVKWSEATDNAARSTARTSRTARRRCIRAWRRSCFTISARAASPT